MPNPKDPDDETKKRKPKTNTETDRGGAGRPPKKTAVGYGGGDDSPVYKPGQLLLCKIVRAEAGGYGVSIIDAPGSDIQQRSLPKQFHTGFLPTKERLIPGEEVLGRFVCIHNQKILLSTNSGVVAGYVGAGDKLPKVEKFDTENFAPFRYKRATDLILPPIQPDSLKQFKIGDYDLDWLISDVEGGKRTGCIKTSSAERRSRAAVLIYHGRAVGCVYGCYSKPDTLPTEQSLKSLLTDLSLPETEVTMYNLPEDATLAMSALFIGYPVSRSDDYDARSYMDYICNWFEAKGTTACVAISLKQTMATCLAFIYRGKFCGAFYVENQKFIEDREIVNELLRNDPKSDAEACILPPEMTASAVRFGFSLSEIRRGL